MDLIISGDGGNPRLFWGVNADLARSIHRNRHNPHSLVTKGLLSKATTPEQLEDVLSLRNPFDRQLDSAKIIGALWAAHSACGPYPIADVLEVLEHERAFYREYREHAALHQLMVYILGLYVYEHNQVIRDAL